MTRSFYSAILTRHQADLSFVELYPYRDGLVIVRANSKETPHSFCIVILNLASDIVHPAFLASSASGTRCADVSLQSLLVTQIALDIEGDPLFAGEIEYCLTSICRYEWRDDNKDTELSHVFALKNGPNGAFKLVKRTVKIQHRPQSTPILVDLRDGKQIATMVDFHQFMLAVSRCGRVLFRKDCDDAEERIHSTHLEGEQGSLVINTSGGCQVLFDFFDMEPQSEAIGYFDAYDFTFTVIQH